MAGYSARQSTYTTGDTIEDADTNDEFNQLLAAFNASTGHTHDGTAGEGAPVGSVKDGVVVNGTTIVFEGTADAFEATLAVTDPTADVTVTLPDATDTLVGKATADTLTNKTLTSAVLNTGISGTAVLDEDTMSSDSATKLATQQSIKAYVDAQLTAEDLDIAGDSGTDAIDLDSETLTLAGGSGITSVASSGTSTVTFNIDASNTTQTSLANLVTVGALNSGSITSGFGNIDNGSSTLDTGAATVASLTSGGDLISDTDGTDSIGSTAVRWLKGWFDSITVTGDVGAATGTFTGEVTGAGFTGTLDGILGGGTPAAATVTSLTSGGDVLSDTDSTDSIGSTGVRWLKGWFDTLTAGTLTIGSGSVTDSSGAISFGDEDLVTTGTLGAGVSTLTSIELGHASDTSITRTGAGAIAVEGNQVYVAGGTDVAVADGGTGASTLTDGGILLGSGTGAITAMSALSDGSIVIGDGTTDPVAYSAFSSSTGTLNVAAGGSGLSSFTAGDILYATGTTTLAKLAKGTPNQVLQMNSGATAPEWVTAAANDGGVAMAIALG